MKRCTLEAEKICNNCGTCDDRCELDPQKICDNCFACLEVDDQAYYEIPISRIYTEEDVLVDDQTLDAGHAHHIQTLPGCKGAMRISDRWDAD